MKVFVLDQDLVLILVSNIWSWYWSRSWRKILQFFKTFVVILDGSEQYKAHHGICERQQQQFAIRKPLFERTFCAPCTTASVERVFNNGGYLLGHTEASKAQCIDCGKLLSAGCNRPGKQTVHGLKCHLEKCHKDIYTLYTRKVESRQQGLPAKKAKLDEVLTAHYRADLVIECMKKKKKKHYIIRWLSFSFFGRKWMFIFVFVSFSAVNGISFSSAYSFTAEYDKCFSVGL